MKEYGDEGFINLLREEREETVKNIKDGTVLVAGENIDFQEREVLQGKMWMWMPDGFGPLSKELARLKYPNENFKGRAGRGNPWLYERDCRKSPACF